MSDLFGEDYVQKSIDRIKEAYTFSQKLGLGKLYVAFSGGKDSVCIYYLCHAAADQMGVPQENFAEYHYNITNLDPPELVQFIKSFKDVKMEQPEMTFWKIAEKNKILPTRLMRYCCRLLKERGGEGRFVVTGVRWAESPNRKERGSLEFFGDSKKERRILNADNDEDRRELEHCIPKRKYVCNPIVDWSDQEVWSYIKSNGFPYCKLYDEGFKRLGCIGCPGASPKELQRMLEKYPKYKAQYLRTCQRIIDIRKATGLSCKDYFTSPEVYLAWWLEQTDKSDGEGLFSEEDTDA